jgi:hypothetical protein
LQDEQSLFCFKNILALKCQKKINEIYEIRKKSDQRFSPEKVRILHKAHTHQAKLMGVCQQPERAAYFKYPNHFGW